jgi:hypothetical protein
MPPARPAVDGRHFYFGPAVGAGAMLFIVTALTGGAAYNRSGANNRRAKRGKMSDISARIASAKKEAESLRDQIKVFARAPTHQRARVSGSPLRRSLQPSVSRRGGRAGQRRWIGQAARHWPGRHWPGTGPAAALFPCIGSRGPQAAREG